MALLSAIFYLLSNSYEATPTVSMKSASDFDFTKKVSLRCVYVTNWLRPTSADNLHGREGVIQLQQSTASKGAPLALHLNLGSTLSCRCFEACIWTVTRFFDSAGLFNSHFHSPDDKAITARLI